MPQNESAALICRVSSREQEDGYSLEAQERLLRDFCNRQSLRVRIIHSFSETASKHSQRLKFRAFMSEVVKGKINHIVVEKVDRLSRGGLKEAVIMDDWLEVDRNRHIHFVKDAIDLHKLSRSGDKLNWGMRVILAKNQTDNLREEVLKSTDVMLKNGIWPSYSPVGYVRDKANTTCPVQPDPKIAPLIQRMFELYDSGDYSLKLLAEHMEELGLRGPRGQKLHLSFLHRVLTNPFYRGQMRYGGKIWPGVHQTLVTQDLFERVQERITRKSSNGSVHYQKHIHRLAGLTVCGSCGKPITWEIQRGTTYGYCKNFTKCLTRASTKEADELALLKPMLSVLRIEHETLRQKIYEGLSLNQQAGLIVRRKLRSQLEDEVRRNNQRLSRLLDLRVDGELTKEDYEAKKNESILAKATAEARIAELETENENLLPSPASIFKSGQEATLTFDTLGPLDQRQLLREVFQVVSINGSQICPSYKPAYAALAKAVQTTNCSKGVNSERFVKRIFEFFKSCSYKQEYPPLRVGIPTWQTYWEEFRTAGSSSSGSFTQSSSENTFTTE